MKESPQHSSSPSNRCKNDGGEGHSPYERMRKGCIVIKKRRSEVKREMRGKERREYTHNFQSEAGTMIAIGIVETM